MVTHDLWLDGPHPGLQGGVYQHSRRQQRILRAVRGTCPRLVSASPGNRSVHEPCDRQSAGRSSSARRSIQGCFRQCPEGGRWRHHCFRRQGRRDLGGDHPIQLHGAVLEDRKRGSEHVVDVPGADRCPGIEADLPHLLRTRGSAQRQPVRLPAVLAISTRTMRSLSWTKYSCRGRTYSSTAIRSAC